MAKRSAAYVAATMLAVALSVGGGTFASSAAGSTRPAVVRCAVGFHPVNVVRRGRIVVRCVRNRPVMPRAITMRPRVTG
jgi:hypothetical protein